MNAAGSTAAGRRRWLTVAKWTLLLLVIAAVGWRAWRLWLEGRRSGGELEWAPGWLVAAAIVYLVGWLPSVWYWRLLLADAGHPVGWLDAARAFYCGHLGKYIPGKATVLVIRAGLLRGSGVPAATAALTATWETLLLMIVGGVVGLALAPTLLDPATVELLPVPLRQLVARPVASAGLVIAVSLAGFPLLTRLVTRIAMLMAGSSTAAATVSTRRFLAGGAVFTLVWALHGLSLGLTLRGVGSTSLALADWPGWTAAAGLATAVGFVAVFAPGGIGVREGLLIESLSRSGMAEQQAVAGAFCLRGVWLAAEIVAALALYYGLPRRTSEDPPADAVDRDSRPRRS